MRIISLRAENIKRLRAVEITPEDDVVVVAGRNAQGKSSVLDAIWMALAGGDAAKETKRPIRDGETQASVELDLGELLVTRRWTEAGTALQVSAKDGARYPSPQTLLDGLIGRLSFDPLEFAQQQPKQQVQTLLEVANVGFDPEKVAVRHRGRRAQGAARAAGVQRRHDRRAAKALGYRRTITYTLASEPGSSLRAAGFVVDAEIPERDWSIESGRARYAENLFGERRTPAGPKLRWRRDLTSPDRGPGQPQEARGR